MVKDFIKNILPKPIRIAVQKQYKKITMLRTYLYDLRRYSKYSATKGFTDSLKLEGIIVKEYHVIEKGLTMPERRLGFGKDKMISLCNNCKKYILTYNIYPEQILHAVGVIKEYQQIHQENNYSLDENINKAIVGLLNLVKNKDVLPRTQLKTTKEEYFKKINESFEDFANSRKSVRNYSTENIDEQDFTDALTLSLNTPSACNRQTSRLYVFSEKEKINDILEIQQGARGFGHLTNKLIVITAELGVFGETTERNQAFIDGGIYAMNLLYALHAKKIACCILNCSNTPEKDRALQKACGTKKSEVFIAMIACGIPPEEFSIAESLRYDLKDICSFI